MKKNSCRNVFFFLLFVCLAGLSGSIAYLFFSIASVVQANNSATNRAVPTATLPASTVIVNAPRKCTSSNQQGFENGVVFPRWSNRAYGGNDQDWLTELPQMVNQTSACWVEMPVLFQQTTLTSTDVAPGPKTPTVASFAYGLHYAHSLGLHVFVTLLVTISTGAEHWVGDVDLPTLAAQQQWFTNYWKTVQPYVVAAQQAGVEQLSIGTEIQWLEDHAPETLWNNLISQFHTTFSGNLTYDINWTALKEPTLPWMKSPYLKMIGISAYAPVIRTSQRIDPQQMPALWASSVKSLVDNYSTQLGEPVFISEVGYRNTVDALFQPWQPTSSATIDAQEQQGACSAVLQNVLTDTRILGNFFWAWDGAENLNLKNSIAAQTIQHYYQSV
jgi:hypothetical protein